jgi:hypothetical protein
MRIHYIRSDKHGAHIATLSLKVVSHPVPFCLTDYHTPSRVSQVIMIIRVIMVITIIITIGVVSVIKIIRVNRVIIALGNLGLLGLLGLFYIVEKKRIFRCAAPVPIETVNLAPGSSYVKTVMQCYRGCHLLSLQYH